MNNKLTDLRLKKLLVSNILLRSANIIAHIFLNIYLFKATNNDIKLVSIFNIIFLSSHLLFFTLFAKIVKFSYRNLLQTISLLGFAFMYLILILLWEEIVKYYTIFAFWAGIFSWIYWIVYDNSEFDLTNIENRSNYEGLKKSLVTLWISIIPSIIWTIIWYNFLWLGYEISFSIWIILFLLSAYFWIIKIDYQKNEKYSLKKAIKKVLKSKNLIKINLNFALFWFSLSIPIIQIILPLLLFNYWVKEAKLWYLISFFSILTIVSSYLFWKFINYKKYKIAYFLSSIFYVLSVFVLFFNTSYSYIVIFSSILNLLYNFVYIPQLVYSANIFQNIKWHEKIKSEYMVIREWPLTLWRILAFVCIFFIWDFDVFSIKIFFWIMAFIIFISSILFVSMDLEEK